MPDFTMLVQTEYGVQERQIVSFEADVSNPGLNKPVPLLLHGEKMMDAPGGGILIIKNRGRKR
jgi:hypothetical protein